MLKNCWRSCISNWPYILFGITRWPFEQLQGRHAYNVLPQPVITQPSSITNLEYPFLTDPEIGELLVMTKFMIILRGPPGSGKSHLAKCIKERFPTSHICSIDNCNSPQMARFDAKLFDNAFDECESEARRCAKEGVSPLVIDNQNSRLFECRPYTEIARNYDYTVILVTPKTPWRFDVKVLAQRSPFYTSVGEVGSIVSQFEPTIYPLFYSWNFAGSSSCNSSTLEPIVEEMAPSEVTKTCIQLYHNAFLTVLSNCYIRMRLAIICGLDPETNMEKLATHWSSSVLPPFGSTDGRGSRPHCTAFYSGFGKAPGAADYANRPAVREALLGAVYSLTVLGLFVSRRTVGLRVRLHTPEELALWGGLDNESVDGFMPTTPRPIGSRAHITLALASGIGTLETGFDALRIVDAEKAMRPDRSTIEFSEGTVHEVLLLHSPVQSDCIFYYEFKVPKIARLMYTANY